MDGLAVERRASPLQVWFGTFAGSALPMFVYSVFGLLLAVVWSYVGPISAVLVLAPLAVARWVFAEFALRQEAYEATMRSLIQAVETKDSYTRGHSERVARASVLIGRFSGMREDRDPPAVVHHGNRVTQRQAPLVQVRGAPGAEVSIEGIAVIARPPVLDERLGDVWIGGVLAGILRASLGEGDAHVAAQHCAISRPGTSLGKIRRVWPVCVVLGRFAD